MEDFDIKEVVQNLNAELKEVPEGYTMFTHEQNYAYEAIKLYTVTENSNTEVIVWTSETGICGENIYDHIKTVLTEIQSEYQSILVTTKNL